MKKLSTENWIRIALGAVALALIVFANYDAVGAIGVAIAVYEFIGYKKDAKIKVKDHQINKLKADVTRFRESKK